MEEKLQTVLFLIRHGDTDKPFSVDPAIDSERVLTELGQLKIAAVGEYLRPFSVNAIYSSPKRRTLQSAEIIREKAEISPHVITRDELLEIYTNEQHEKIKDNIPVLFKEIVEKHAGEHVVCVSHQDLIEGALEVLQVTVEEAELPCRMAEGYRLVFVGETFVQATKINPAKNIL